MWRLIARTYGPFDFSRDTGALFRIKPENAEGDVLDESVRERARKAPPGGRRPPRRVCWQSKWLGAYLRASIN